MKRVKLLILSLVIVFMASGCTFGSSTLEDATIYTTIYPIEYIIDYLYGDYSTIESIYPEDADISSYTLTDKQISGYASGDLFVYLGQNDELETAKSLVNSNSNLLIIDASYGLSYENSVEELWLAPNNFLMLAKNVRNSLIEYLDNTYLMTSVNNNYDDLYESVSWLDAELRSIGKEFSDETLVVSTNALLFLEDYGFNVISLDSITSETAINDIESKFKNSTYTKILTLSNEEESDLVSSLTSSYGAETTSLNVMLTNTDTSSDYVSMQYENLAVIREYFED